jgi:hypothetical protein
MILPSSGSKIPLWTYADKTTLRPLAQLCHKMTGRADPHCPSPSNVNLFRYGKGIINLDPEVPDGAFDLGDTNITYKCKGCGSEMKHAFRQSS